VLNTALYFAFYRVGAWGVPLAISLANIAGVALLFVALRRRIGRLDLTATVRSFVRVAAASAALALVSFAIWWALDRVLGRSFAAQALSLGAALTVGGVVYLGVCRALGVREVATLLSLRDRFRRDR
jgi:peptidoglycan biosynthesis protein MviN/MurJ (putative lipid II flippase)